VALLAIFSSFVSADQIEISPGDLVFGVGCREPASTPDCASLSWDECFRYRDPARCAQVGFSGMRFWDWRQLPARRIELPVLATPQESYQGRTEGVRRVGPERFREGLEEPGAFEAPPHMIGTHEVTYRLQICDKGPCTARASEFFRKQEDRWVITSWTDSALSCEGWAASDEPHCAIYIPFLKRWSPRQGRR